MANDMGSVPACSFVLRKAQHVTYSLMGFAMFGGTRTRCEKKKLEATVFRG